ncbi:Integrase [Polaromonas sp. CG9_12]|nr:Integrase [Polaromonas sp. CG9_12]
MQHDSILKSRLTPAHIALAKAWINGLDLASMATRYLPALGDDDGQIDLRSAKSSLIAVLADLSGAAHRHNIPGSAVLSRQAARIRVDASRPSLQDFQESLDHGDDMSEGELIALYDERYPNSDKKTDRSLARKGRLINRQLALLARLEPLVSTPLTLDDEVQGWFVPSLADRLAQSGLKTIEDLAIAMAGNPGEWFTSVAGIGTLKATRIERFLHAHLGSLEEALDQKGIAYKIDLPPAEEKQGLRLSLEACAAVVPFSDRTVVRGSLARPGGNPALDGSKGRLRQLGTPAATEAGNDYEAMQTWLQLKASASTVTLYRREITRLIAWSIQVRQRPMSSLSIEDALAYRDFLGAVPPSFQVKKGPKKRTVAEKQVHEERQDIAVASFTQASLATSSIKKSLVVINGFFNWLVSVRYVTANPFSGVKAASVLPGKGQGTTSADDVESLEFARWRKESIVERALPREATEAIDSYLDFAHEAKDEEFKTRAAFIYRFGMMTGLRVSELAAARRDHLEYIEADSSTGSGGWILHVVGKQSKAREVPMPDALVVHLQDYLVHRGLLESPSTSINVPSGTFLVGGYASKLRDKRAGDGVMPQTIHRALKELFAMAINSRTFKDPKAGDKLRRATTHWLRHTAATRAVAAQVPLDVVASTLGHSSLTTTSRYVRAERVRKLAEMQKLWADQAN